MTKIVAMKRAHVPHDEIAKELELSPAYVHTLYKKALADHPLTAMAIDEYRAEQCDLIDAAVRDLMALSYNSRLTPRSRIDAWLAVERFSKAKRELLGLDAPTKHEVTTIGALDQEIAKLEAELDGPKRRPQLPRRHPPRTPPAIEGTEGP
jgi:hypothetical protein